MARMILPDHTDVVHYEVIHSATPHVAGSERFPTDGERAVHPSDTVPDWRMNCVRTIGTCG